MHYNLPATRGDITIGNNSTSPALRPGDNCLNRDIGGYSNKENGIYPIKASCVFNTVYRTHRGSYYGPYYGFVADNVNQDTLDCCYNLMVAPEADYPFDTSRSYIVASFQKHPNTRKQPVIKFSKAGTGA